MTKIAARHLLVMAFAAALVAPAAAQDAPKLSVPAALRNVRYCEIIAVRRERLTLNVEVYNTLGLNFCPAEAWGKLDAKALAKERKLTAVKLNGPRYWTIDMIEAQGATASGKIEHFGGVPMVLRATLSTKLWQGSVGDKFYTPNVVKRTTVFHYRAGRPVYELVSPKGEVYMMQSYAQIVDATLTMDDLPKLGERLKLPKGWTFRTRVLTDDYALTADGTAYVINDEMYNSYQRQTK
ncbi:hypothetical protein [Pseudolabrys taiwanensis]|nr:hypothetical protein [Pseudolabrys taiwanensis]